jgi:hypothetical protein
MQFIRGITALLLLSGSSAIFLVAGNVLAATAVRPGDIVLQPGVTLHHEPRLEPVTSHMPGLAPVISPELQLIIGMLLILAAFGLYTYAIMRQREPHVREGLSLGQWFRAQLDRTIV